MTLAHPSLESRLDSTSRNKTSCCEHPRHHGPWPGEPSWYQYFQADITRVGEENTPSSNTIPQGTGDLAQRTKQADKSGHRHCTESHMRVWDPPNRPGQRGPNRLGAQEPCSFVSRWHLPDLSGDRLDVDAAWLAHLFACSKWFRQDPPSEPVEVQKPEINQSAAICPNARTVQLAKGIGLGYPGLFRSDRGRVSTNNPSGFFPSAS